MLQQLWSSGARTGTLCFPLFIINCNDIKAKTKNLQETERKGEENQWVSHATHTRDAALTNTGGVRREESDRVGVGVGGGEGGERSRDGRSESASDAAAPRRHRRRPAGVLRRPVRSRLQGVLQPELPRGRAAADRRGALLHARVAVRLRQVLQDVVLGVVFLDLLRLRPVPVPRRPLRLRLRRLRLPRHVLLVRRLRRLRRRAGPAHRLPRALRDIRVPPGVRHSDAVQDLRHRRRRRHRLRDAPRHRLRPAGGQRRREQRRLLRHQLPAGVRHGAVRGRPLLGGLRPVRHPGRPARRGRVRGRAIRPGVP
uniref:Uncharacterized protein n=1 Tax=Oryza brachyantha TaxID=4533 RepID=J3LJU9_ORYBR